MRKLLLAAALVLGLAAPARAVQYVAVANFPDCISQQDIAGNPFLAAHHPTVVRIILYQWMPAIGAERACVAKAEAQGYGVYLSIVWSNSLTPPQVAAYYARVLAEYGGSKLWAVSGGNEQDLGDDKGGTLGGRSRVCGHHHATRKHGWASLSLLCIPGTAAQGYRADWDAIEPVMRVMAPHALRVFGEAGPWGWSFLRDAWHAEGRPPAGVDAVSLHAYNLVDRTIGLGAMPAWAREAASWHVPFWDSENYPSHNPKHTGNIHDTWASWAAALARADAAAPNVQMETVYDWPTL